jgi:hypothetical protein
MTAVFVTDQFLFILEAVLAGGSGPTSDQFLAGELMFIRNHFAENWDGLLYHPSNPDYRSLFVANRSVPLYEIQGRIRADGVIEIIGVTVDWEFG